MNTMDRACKQQGSFKEKVTYTLNQIETIGRRAWKNSTLNGKRMREGTTSPPPDELMSMDSRMRSGRDCKKRNVAKSYKG